MNIKTTTVKTWAINGNPNKTVTSNDVRKVRKAYPNENLTLLTEEKVQYDADVEKIVFEGRSWKRIEL